MSGMFFTGSSADGSDMRPALGMFVDNEENPTKWSTAPFTDAQREYVKKYNFHWKLMKKCDYDMEVIYHKIKDGSVRFFTKVEKDYIVEQFENQDNE